MGGRCGSGEGRRQALGACTETRLLLLPRGKPRLLLPILLRGELLLLLLLLPILLLTILLLLPLLLQRRPSMAPS